jgi:hypothetical protein
VYVELRAAQADWERPIQSKVRNWPPRSLANDKRLHHMATPHQAALSYLTFGELWSVVSSEELWDMFSPYFPPKKNTEVRIDEVKAIRNRTAHFREPHAQDVARLELFMRDMEPGIRRFCARYTVAKFPSDPTKEPVSEALELAWDHVGYGIELQKPHGWLYAPLPHRMDPLMNARLEVLTHHKYSAGSSQGVIYQVTAVSNTPKRPIDTVALFDSTRRLHGDIIHFIISSPHDGISITVPAVHGTEKTTSLISDFLQAGLQASRGGSPAPLDRKKLEWPEYVLWPDHMLAFFLPEIQESILDVE